MTLSDQQWEFLKDVAKLLAYAEHKGFKLTAGELYRTKEQQAIYLKKGLTKARPGESLHESRLAIDLNVFVLERLTHRKEAIEPLGRYWESLTPLNRWGGNFSGFGLDGDSGHFERMIEQ